MFVKTEGGIPMRAGVGRRLMVWAAVGICGLMALGAGSASAEEALSGSTESLSGSLSSPPVEAIAGGSAPVLVASTSPEAVAEREASRTAYVGLSGEAVVGLAERVFGVERPGWVEPGTQDGGRLTSYLGEHDAVETSSSGTHLLVASSVPLRSAVGSGRLEPVSLALVDHGGSFAPANPFAPVSFSKEASDGVGFPLGLRVAPVVVAGGEPARTTGDRVVYPNAAPDTDFMAEALPWVFDHDVKPSFSHSKGYDYLEICGKNGHRRGYLRVKDNAVFTGAKIGFYSPV
jgi:hypothetical protein